MHSYGERFKVNAEETDLQLVHENACKTCIPILWIGPPCGLTVSGLYGSGEAHCMPTRGGWLYEYCMKGGTNRLESTRDNALTQSPEGS